MIYGKPLVHRTDDRTDKIGIRTLVLSQMWQGSRSDLTQAELDEEQPGVPDVSGAMLLVGVQTRRSGGVYLTTWTFEGIRGDGKEVTFKDRTNTLDYGFEHAMSQVSLKLWRTPGGTDFKTFPQLLEGYEGYLDQDSDQIVWPAALSKSASERGLKGNARGIGDVNPMFGQQDWFRFEGTYRCRYAAVDEPAGLNLGINRVSTNLPGKPPSFGDGRNWLKLPPLVKRRGFITEIIELYWLSGPGGWPAPVYGGA